MQDASPNVAAATAGHWNLELGRMALCFLQSLIAMMVVGGYGCLFVRRAESQDTFVSVREWDMQERRRLSWLE